jgi:hypothetical protein
MPSKPHWSTRRRTGANTVSVHCPYLEVFGTRILPTVFNRRDLICCDRRVRNGVGARWLCIRCTPRRKCEETWRKCDTDCTHFRFADYVSRAASRKCIAAKSQVFMNAQWSLHHWLQ